MDKKGERVVFDNKFKLCKENEIAFNFLSAL